MDKPILVAGAIILVIVIIAFLYFYPAQLGTIPPGIGPDGATPIVSGLLVQGAACEQDSDCMYALNAYPIKRCISGNCPPEDDPNQPEPGDPAYEWFDTYQPSCVNANDLQNKNILGEDLQFDPREHECECVPFQSPEGHPTSLDGQKLCQEKKNTS